MKTVNLMIVGVGGQGTLLSSKVLGNLFLSEGYDVKVSEVHGMSQRGGSVVTYVRYGENVASPVICEGEADYIIAFEKLEAARYYPYLRKGGHVIVNRQEIDPMPVIVGQTTYPKEILEEIKANASVTDVDAQTLALEAGSVKTANIVLLGVLATFFPEISPEKWKQIISATVPEKFREMNLRAFDLGYGAIRA